MRVLVTGGAGFLGKHVVAELVSRGYDVSAPRHEQFRLPRQAASMLQRYEPTTIVHLAADAGGIGYNVAYPGRLFHDNIAMGVDLMDRARLAGVEKMVTVGTACMYPEHAEMPLREDDLWNGRPALETLPYAEAKRALLVMGQAYRSEYGFDAVFLIPTNLYGPGDDFDPESSHVVPGMIRRLDEAARDEAASVRCWGTGTATRDFLYVTDAARAVVLAIERYDEPEPVNVGTGVETPIAELVNKVADRFGYRGRIEWDASRPDGTPRRVLDVSRAEAAFGFRAEVDLDEGLERTVAWYRDNVAA
jgi:GDP-L-fucose synthase